MDSNDRQTSDSLQTHVRCSVLLQAGKVYKPFDEGMQVRMSMHLTGAGKLQVPKEISDQLEAVKDNDDATKKLGIKLGTQMCRKLLDSGVPGLHMYTLNLDRSALAILENLGLIRGRVSSSTDF